MTVPPIRRSVPPFLLLAVACQAPHSSPEVSADAAAVLSHEAEGLPPVDALGEHETIWEYLLARYDANGDGVVTREEHGREKFERVDKNGDGRITEADFSSEGRELMAAAQNAQMLVAWYFQDDGDANTLTRDELAVAFDTYDTGGDGWLDEEEFGCAAEERREWGKRPTRRAVRELDALAAILGQSDGDGDGLLARTELLGFFDARDNGDGEWRLGRPSGGSTPRQGPTGVSEGQPAPDFTLEPPGGGAKVTLSSFAGKRPVALIFGSYT